MGFILLSTVIGALMDDPVGFSEGGGTLQQTACSCCSRGDPGQPGLPGAPGPTGVPGHQGVPGMSGNPGSHGTNGIPGLHGEKGSPGPAGPVGPMGEPGPKGTLGKIGPPGQRGPRGHEGIPGVPGLDGALGAKGEKGDKGASGDIGTIYWPESGPYHIHHSQSAFSVACSNEVQAKPIEDTVLLFDTVFVNLGNDFDSARGTFHCRVNGTYYFIVHANKWSNQNDLFLKLMKNGEMKIGIYEDAGYDYYDMASNSMLLHLVEGDRVWLQLHTNDRVYGGLSRMTTFSGWLIYEDPIV